MKSDIVSPNNVLMYGMMHDQLQQQQPRRVLERFALLPYVILQFDGIVSFESNRSDSVVVCLPAITN
jgi:hypothetical protein